MPSKSPCYSKDIVMSLKLLTDSCMMTLTYIGSWIDHQVGRNILRLLCQMRRAICWDVYSYACLRFCPSAINSVVVACVDASVPLVGISFVWRCSSFICSRNISIFLINSCILRSLRVYFSCTVQVVESIIIELFLNSFRIDTSDTSVDSAASFHSLFATSISFWKLHWREETVLSKTSFVHRLWPRRVCQINHLFYLFFLDIDSFPESRKLPHTPPFIGLPNLIRCGAFNFLGGDTFRWLSCWRACIVPDKCNSLRYSVIFGVRQNWVSLRTCRIRQG